MSAILMSGLVYTSAQAQDRDHAYYRPHYDRGDYHFRAEHRDRDRYFDDHAWYGERHRDFDRDRYRPVYHHDYDRYRYERHYDRW
jgi:hypothetical protein